jgi:hypothetical protein
MKKNSALPSFSFLIISVLGVLPKQTLAQKPTEIVTIIQEGNTYSLKPGNQSISLTKTGFSIRASVQKYNEKKGKFNAIQIAVRTTNEGTAQLGQKISDIVYFAPGTGMAPDSNERYNYLFINNEAHHYITYESKHKNRADLIRSENGFYELDISVLGFYDLEKEISIKDFNREELFFEVLINRNLNDTIDEGELTQIHIQFK